MTTTTATSTTATITTGGVTTTGPAATATPSRITDNLSAADLGSALSEVELAAAHGDGTVGPRQQHLYRYLSAHADLDAAVLANVAADVRPAVERIVSARQFGQARQASSPSTSPPSDTLPAWRRRAVVGRRAAR